MGWKGCSRINKSGVFFKWAGSNHDLIVRPDSPCKQHAGRLDGSEWNDGGNGRKVMSFWSFGGWGEGGYIQTKPDLNKLKHPHGYRNLTASTRTIQGAGSLSQHHNPKSKHTDTSIHTHIHWSAQAWGKESLTSGLRATNPPRLKQTPCILQKEASLHSQTTSLTWATAPPFNQPALHSAALTIHTNIIYSSALVDWTPSCPQDRSSIDRKLCEGRFRTVVNK